jgi:cell division protein FtsW
MDATIYRLKYRDVLTICVVALLTFGVIMVQSASMRVRAPDGDPASVNPDLTWHWTNAGMQQLKLAIAALGVYLLLSRIDYLWLSRGSLKRNPTLWLAGIAALLCLLVLVPGLGKEINGARRWLRFAPLQPSELGKWSVVFFLAYCLAFRPFQIERFFDGFLPMLVPVGVITLLVIIQDFGTAALIALCTVVICMAGRAKLWHLMVVLVPAVMIGFWFVHHKAYRWRRIVAFMDPYSAPQKEGYHMIQSLLSFSTGGVFGRGLGNGVQKLGYLPEDTTDFIFAVICEELGLFGALLTIALYLGILFVAWQVIRRKRDSFGRLLAFGVGSMIGLQALINIAVATVSVPTKGLSLPLVSAGGSGLVITCGALGILASVCRHVHAEETLPERPPPKPRIGPLLRRRKKPVEKSDTPWDITSTDLAGAL